jgi:hypothetical protein
MSVGAASLGCRRRDFADRLHPAIPRTVVGRLDARIISITLRRRAVRARLPGHRACTPCAAGGAAEVCRTGVRPARGPRTQHKSRNNDIRPAEKPNRPGIGAPIVVAIPSTRPSRNAPSGLAAPSCRGPRARSLGSLQPAVAYGRFTLQHGAARAGGLPGSCRACCRRAQVGPRLPGLRQECGRPGACSRAGERIVGWGIRVEPQRLRAVWARTASIGGSGPPRSNRRLHRKEAVAVFATRSRRPFQHGARQHALRHARRMPGSDALAPMRPPLATSPSRWAQAVTLPKASSGPWQHLCIGNEDNGFAFRQRRTGNSRHGSVSQRAMALPRFGRIAPNGVQCF